MPMPDGPQFLPVHKFQQKYRVAGQYDEGTTWDNLTEDEAYWEGAGHVVAPEGEINANDLDALEDDIRKRGIQRPVRVRNGLVIDGHHRVSIARGIRKNFPIPYIEE